MLRKQICWYSGIPCKASCVRDMEVYSRLLTYTVWYTILDHTCKLAHKNLAVISTFYHHYSLEYIIKHAHTCTHVHADLQL